MAPYYFNSLFTLILLLYSFNGGQSYSSAADLIGKVCKQRMASLTAKKYTLDQKNVEKTGFPGFSGKLQGNVSQFYCIAPVKLKLTGYLPTLACKVYQKRKRQLHAEKLRFGPKISKNGFFGFSVTHYNHLEFYCVTPRSLKLTNVLPYWRHKVFKKKEAIFSKRKLRFRPKNVKGSGVFRFSGLHQNASDLHCMIPIMLKLTEQPRNWK